MATTTTITRQQSLQIVSASNSFFDDRRKSCWQTRIGNCRLQARQMEQRRLVRKCRSRGHHSTDYLRHVTTSGGKRMSESGNETVHGGDEGGGVRMEGGPVGVGLQHPLHRRQVAGLRQQLQPHSRLPFPLGPAIHCYTVTPVF